MKNPYPKDSRMAQHFDRWAAVSAQAREDFITGCNEAYEDNPARMHGAISAEWEAARKAHDFLA